MLNEIVHLIEKYFPGLFSKGTKKLEAAKTTFEAILTDVQAAEQHLKDEIARKKAFAKEKEAAFEAFLKSHEAEVATLADSAKQAVTFAENLGKLLGK